MWTGDSKMTEINDIQLLNMRVLGTLNELEKVASLINNAVNNADQRELLSIDKTQKTIERLRSESIALYVKMSDMLD